MLDELEDAHQAAPLDPKQHECNFGAAGLRLKMAANAIQALNNAFKMRSRTEKADVFASIIRSRAYLSAEALVRRASVEPVASRLSVKAHDRVKGCLSTRSHASEAVFERPVSQSDIKYEFIPYRHDGGTIWNFIHFIPEYSSADSSQPSYLFAKAVRDDIARKGRTVAPGKYQFAYSMIARQSGSAVKIFQNARRMIEGDMAIPDDVKADALALMDEGLDMFQVDSLKRRQRKELRTAGLSHELTVW